MASTAAATSTTAAAPPPLHDSTARGFTAETITVYETGRPEWQREHFDALLTRLGADAWERGPDGRFPAHSVVELGSGTGKSTRPLHSLLKARCAPGVQPRLVCVEPTPFGTNLAADLGAVLVSAQAEDLSAIASGSAQVVIACQSFHWFANATALSEIHRVLAPGGYFAALWNIRYPSAPWEQAIEDIITRHYDDDTPRPHTGAWRREVEGHGGYGAIQSLVLPREGGGFTADESGVVAMVLSMSVIAKLTAEAQAAIEARVRAILEGRDVTTVPRRQQGVGDDVPLYTIPMRTEVYWMQKV